MNQSLIKTKRQLTNISTATHETLLATANSLGITSESLASLLVTRGVKQPLLTLHPTAQWERESRQGISLSAEAHNDLKLMAGRVGMKLERLAELLVFQGLAELQQNKTLTISLA